MASLIQTRKLSHLGLNVRDIDAQTAFYRDCVGLQVERRDAADRVYLRCSEEHHALILIPSNHENSHRLHHHALDVGSREALEEGITALLRAGIPLLELDFDELGQPAACRFHDPNQFVVELVANMEKGTAPIGPRAVTPRRYGHLTLRVNDLKETVEFYREILGFRESDWLGEQFCWLRCTPEHHGLALSAHARAPMMHHLAFHVRDIGELVQQAEHLMRHDRHLLYGPGR
ncbi:MAG: VOC family protein, partial [Chloroflexota bacterium]